MAEVLLRRRIEQAGGTATVTSAGLYEGGMPATTHGIAAMADRGLDLRSHRSRRVHADLLRDADLVVGMAREHVREIAVLEPAAVDRSFTLKELVRLGELSGGRRPDEALADWLARVGATRRRDDLLGVGHDPAFDIADPIGRARPEYDATADELDGLLERLVALLWSTAAHEQERSA